jgi:hypothetical protein
MDWGKLSANEKLAVYGAIATLIGGAVGGTVSFLGWLALLAAIGVLAVVFLPQLSPQTNLPGSSGSLLLLLGGIAAVIMVLALLSIIGFLGFYFSAAPISAILFLIAVAGAVVMAWAGWQAFQAEGGKFQIGTQAGPRTTGTTPPPPPPAEPTQSEERRDEF